MSLTKNELQMESIFYPNIVKATPDPSRQVILIGIGGTGLIALEEVKKIEYKYLKNGNEDSTLPKSLHYLYIDSDAHSLDLASDLFSQEECFLLESLSSSNSGLCRAAQALANEYNLSSSIWRNGHDSQVDKRIARLLLVQHTGELVMRLDNIFSKASRISSEFLDVYIIASLAGSTGGGTFIDISYIVKWLLRGLQHSYKTSVFGFFTVAEEARQQIFNNMMPMHLNDILTSNSITSLLELQRCMTLDEYNTVFCQSYDRFTINTSDRPLDTYFLFGGESAPMQTMAECILSGITQAAESDYDRLYKSNHFFHLSSMFSNLGSQRISFFSIGSSYLYAPIEQAAAALYITVLTDCGLCADNSGKPEVSSVENYSLSFAKSLVSRIQFYLQTTSNKLELPKLTSYNAKTRKDGIPMLWMEIGSKYVSLHQDDNRSIVSRMLDDIDNFATYSYGHIPSSFFSDIYGKLVSLFIEAPQGPALVTALLSPSGIPMALTTEIDRAKKNMTDLDTVADQYRSELAKSKFVFSFFQHHYLEIATDYYNALTEHDEEECLVIVLEAIIRRIEDLHDNYFAPLSHQSFQFANFCSTKLDKLCLESSSNLNDDLYQFPASPKIYLNMAEANLQNVNIYEIRRALLDDIFSLSSLSQNDFADVAKMLSRICQDCFMSFLQSILENSWQAQNMIVPTINRQMEIALRDDSIAQFNSQLNTCILTKMLFLPPSLITNYLSILEESSQMIDNELKIYSLNTTGRIHAIALRSYSFDKQLCQDYYSIYYKALRNEAKNIPQYNQNFVLASSIGEIQKTMRTKSPVTEDAASARLRKLLMTADEGGVLTEEQLEELANLQAIHLYNYVPGPSLMLLKKLRQLKLSGKEVMNTPNSIDCLQSLEVLDLSDTQISRIPPEIGHLKHLKTLNLSGLFLEEFPLFLLKLPLNFTRKENEGILIDNLKAQDMDDLGILFTNRIMRDVWFRNQKGVSFDDSPAVDGEIKVVLLGDAKVGKTLTIRRILEDGALIPDYKEDATRGISINTKIIQTSVGNIRLRLWDFGGQDIYYAMHRLFFTAQTIYVVMVSARETNAEKNACFWLSNVKDFAPDCPVLVYINQIDQIPEPTISRKQLVEGNPSLRSISYMSALKDDQSTFISKAVDPIVKLVTEMNSGIFKNIPESWLEVRKQIVESHRNYLTDKDFFSLCDRFGVSNNRSERNRLLSWLNNLGIGFSGSSKYLGGHYTVLDPEWITRALYFLLNYRSYFKDGIVSAEDCLNLQDQKRGEGKSDIPSYYTSDYNFIFESLRQFRLAYLLKDGRYMIPMLCLEENPELGEPVFCQ